MTDTDIQHQDEVVSPTAAAAVTLAHRWQDIKTRIDELDKELAATGAELVRLLEPGAKVDTGNGTGIRIQAGSKRFDGHLAKEVLTPEMYATILVSKPDAAYARRVLPGALFELCQTTSDPSVRAL